MKKVVLAGLLILINACGGESITTENENSCQLPQSPAVTGCTSSPYNWGDDILYVCAIDLNPRAVSGEGEIPVGLFTLINYRGIWTHIGEVCIQSIGSSPMSGIELIKFDTLDTAQSTITVQKPWSNNGKVCANIPITVGAESQVLLMVSVQLNHPVTNGASYQFELTQASDITLDDTAYPNESIEGGFPILTDTITVAP